MNDFKKSFFGYDTQQVEKQLQQLQGEQQKIWDELTAQVVSLEEENKKLKEQVESLKQENKLVSDTLVDAQQAADGIKRQAKEENDRILANAKSVVSKLMEYSNLVTSISGEITELSTELDSNEKQTASIPGSHDLDVSGLLKGDGANIPDEEEPNATLIDGKEVVVTTQVVESDEDGTVKANVIQKEMDAPSKQAEDFKRSLEMDKQGSKLSKAITENDSGSVADAIMGYIRK